MEKPNLYIIAGCNGAGKTTASFNVLPTVLDCREFVNADEIAKGLSPFAPETVAIQAGKLMLERIERLLADGVTFAIETTLATRCYKNLVLRAKEKGYNVSLLFFWLESPEVACERVRKRVTEGGHDIPRDTIHRRYWLGLENLFRVFMPIVDDWAFYDNNNETHLIADTNGILNRSLYTNITDSLCQRKNNWK